MSTLQTTHIGRQWPKKQLLIQGDLQESQVHMSDDHVKVTEYVKHLLTFPSHPEEVKAGPNLTERRRQVFFPRFCQTSRSRTHSGRSCSHGTRLNASPFLRSLEHFLQIWTLQNV